MSTKKDKFSLTDRNYMKLAINLARARQGLTGANPSVGCVITKNDDIISIGQTGFNGRPHAETNAINNSLQNLSGAKMYVTHLNLAIIMEKHLHVQKKLLKVALKKFFIL